MENLLGFFGILIGKVPFRNWRSFVLVGTEPMMDDDNSCLFFAHRPMGAGSQYKPEAPPFTLSHASCSSVLMFF